MSKSSTITKKSSLPVLILDKIAPDQRAHIFPRLSKWRVFLAIVASLVFTFGIMSHRDEHRELKILLDMLLGAPFKDVIEVLERHSTEFKTIRIEYELCLSKKGCNTKPFIAHLNEILEQEWPQIFRVIYRSDGWADSEYAQEQRRVFRQQLKIWGKEFLQHRCPPRILPQPSKDRPRFLLRYTCESALRIASGPPAGGFFFT